MKNIYVTRITHLTEELLKEAQNLDKTDIIYLITEKNGTMPIALYPHFKTLSCNVQIIYADISEEALAFSLGLMCKENNGSIYFILSRTDTFSCLKDKIFDIGKNTTQIIVQSHFINDKNDKQPVKRTRKPKTENINTENTNIKSDIKKQPTISKQEIKPKKETSTYVVKTKKTKSLSVHSQTDIMNKKPSYIPEKFITTLENINTTAFDIDKDIIFLYEAIKGATDADTSLAFQIQMCFGDDRKDAIYKVLKSKFNTLKRILN